MNKLILKGVAMLMLAFACSGSAFAVVMMLFRTRR